MMCSQTELESQGARSPHRPGGLAAGSRAASETARIEAAVAEFRVLAAQLEPSQLRAVLQVGRMLAGGADLHPAVDGWQPWSRRV